MSPKGINDELRWYHVGVTDESPVQVAHLAGVDFPRHTEEIVWDATGNSSRNRRRGDMKRLRPSHVERIMRVAETKMVRWIGNRKRARVFTTLSGKYRPQANDEPMSKYIFCNEVTPEVAGMFSQASASKTIAEVRAEEAARVSEAIAAADPEDAKFRAEAAEAKREGFVFDGDEFVEAKPKRKRGRPRKTPVA